MGRTKRSRCRKKYTSQNINLNQEVDLINLRKWMYSNKFSDCLNLQLRNFSNTGRGVTSKKSVKEHDILIKVPFHLMISFTTIKDSGELENLIDGKVFTIHELLAFFLLIERHKEHISKWYSYICTLPFPEPNLPWLIKDDIKTYPKDLRNTAEKLQANFHESFERLRKSIIPSSLCECCKKPLHCVFELNLFKWSYAMVNTRAVYVDPYYYADAKNTEKLSDEPSMALCPFLDMFNHDCFAQTEVNVVQENKDKFYELRTLRRYQKYEQFFISYGAHDNEKLLMEYGFFIPGNIFDSIKFHFDEVVDALKFVFNKYQFTFLKNNKLMKDFYISHVEGVSFNLKAIIFVAKNPEVVNYNVIIFSDYPETFASVVQVCEKVLLEYKMKNITKKESYNNLLNDYLDYRMEYLEKMYKNLTVTEEQ